MRTTLDLDDDLVAALRRLARKEGRTMGQVVSDLVRHALTPGTVHEVRNGAPLLRARPDEGPVTMALVNALRDG